MRHEPPLASPLLYNYHFKYPETQCLDKNRRENILKHWKGGMRSSETRKRRLSVKQTAVSGGADFLRIHRFGERKEQWL